MPDQFTGIPVIDNRGNVAFIAGHGLAVTQSSVWIASDSSLRRVARSDEPAPNTGANFARFSDLVIADDGVIAFKALLSGTPTSADNRNSIWLDRSGSLTLVAQVGQEAPDPARNLRFSAFETPVALSGDGHLAIFARTRDKENAAFQSSGLWLADANAISQAASADGAAIAGEPDVVFSAQSFEAPFAADPIISAAGQTVFRGFLAGPGVDDTNLNGLWSYNKSTGLQLLLRAGDEAVGTGGQPFLSFPGVPTINAAGDTAFLAFFGAAHNDENENGAAPGSIPTDLDVTQHDDYADETGLGLWMRRASGELTHVVSIGDHAAGIAGDIHFVDTFDPVMNATGRIAFLAAVEGEGVDDSNEVGLWSSGMSPDGALRLVAREGEHAPGTEGGFMFGVFLEPSLNAAGQSAFMAAGYRQQEGQILDSALGIWGQDRVGQLRLVARVGQLLELGPGDEREIAALAFASETGGQDGKARGLNDRGAIAFRATFTDGTSGVFVSSALMVPEPGAATLMVLALAGMRRVRQAKSCGRNLGSWNNRLRDAICIGRED